ncbi:MAG: hypothetical protein HY695_12260 [Deltaproteobacteria bacterium]|nr:hypothetical protein [Deltaproteobacteria bacterium]
MWLETDAESAPGQPLREALLLLACIAPLATYPWVLAIWPGQDNPNHLAVTYFVAELLHGDSPFEDILEANLRPRPFSLLYYYYLLAGKAFGLPAADLVLVTFLLAIFPILTWLLLRRLLPGRWYNAVLIAPLASTWILMIGFMHYLLGLAFVLAALGLSARRTEGLLTQNWSATPAVSLLLVLAVLAHGAALPLAILGLVALHLPDISTRRGWSFLLAATAPGLLVLLADIPAYRDGLSPGRFSIQYRSLVPNAWDLVVQLAPLAFAELLVRLPVLGLLAISAARSVAKFGLRGRQPQAALARLCACLAAAYFLLPTHVASRAYYVNARVAFPLYVGLALAASTPKVLQRVGTQTFVGLGLSLAIAFVQFHTALPISDRIAEIVKLGDSIRPGSTFIPLQFRPQGDALGYAPLLHVWGYISIRRNALAPYLFADGGTTKYGRVGSRVLSFRKQFGPDFFPFVSEWAPSTRDPEVYSQLISAARGYDYALLVDPPDEFLALAREQWEEQDSAGAVYLFRTRTTAR